MKPSRFDQFTRRAAARGLIGALAGAALAAITREPAAARPNSVPLGGVCYRSHQCINEYAASGGRGLNPDLQVPACASNGFDWDGDMNCCLWEGGFCRGDNECCGLLACNDGFCGPYQYGWYG